MRLQLDEEVASFYEDPDLDTYIELAARRFVNKTKAIVAKKTFTIDNTKVSKDSIAAAEVLTITCIADETAQGTLSGSITAAASADSGASTKFTTSVAHGLNLGEFVILSGFNTNTDYNATFEITLIDSTTEFTVVVVFGSTEAGSWAGTGLTLSGKHFKIFTKAGVEHLVFYDVDNASSAPTLPTGAVLIEVDISADDTAATVASATSTAIDAVTGFTATVLDDVVTVTLLIGFVGKTHVNVDVANGGNEFSIVVATAGLDEFFDIGDKIIKERGLTFIDEDSRKFVMRRIAWEDWNRLTPDNRNDFFVYVIDTRKNALYLPNFTVGTVESEFFLHGDSVNLSTFLSDESLPAEYHEYIANYALVLAFRRDREFEIANRYLTIYIHDERTAAEEIGNRLSSSQAGDFSFDIINVHRHEPNLIASINDNVRLSRINRT